MLKYLARRLLASIPVLIAVTIIIFTLVLAPGDVADHYISGSSYSEEALQAIRRQFGLDQPLCVTSSGRQMRCRAKWAAATSAASRCS